MIVGFVLVFEVVNEGGVCVEVVSEGDGLVFEAVSDGWVCVDV